MSSEEDLRQIQETEIEALRGSFAHDQLQRLLRLPLSLDSRFARKKLNYKTGLPRLYPTTRPTLVLEDAIGLSPTQLSQLQEQLSAKTTQLIGSEMLYELATFVAEFITEHNMSITSVHHPSLIEERVTRATEVERQERLAIEAEKARQLSLKSHEDLELARQIQKDIDLRHELLKRERVKAHVNSHNQYETKTSVDSISHLPFGTLIEIPLPTGPLKIQVGSEVLDGFIIGSLYNAQVSGFGPAQLITVHPQGRYYHSLQGQKMLSKVASDLDTLRNINDPHIQLICGSELAEAKLTIVSECLTGNSVRDILDQCGPFELEKALDCLEQILSGLKAVHHAHLVHRGIKPENIFMCSAKERSKKTVFKLANVSWFQRLWDLCKSNPFCELPHDPQRPDLWIHPNTLRDPLAYDRERDLFDLGVTFAQMLFGELWPKWDSPSVFLQSLPADYPSIFRELLGSLLLSSKKNNVQQLLDKLSNFRRMTKRICPTPARPLSHGRNWEKPVDSVVPHGVFWQPQGTTYSRYRNDFEEVEFLGKGGFGEVLKARNKLDNRFYAIKKISLPMDPREETKILREVTILSRMSHPHIVRYHACWIEATDVAPSSANSEFSQVSSNIPHSQPQGVGRHQYSHSDSDSERQSDDSESSDSSRSIDVGDNTTIHEFNLGLDDMDFLSIHHDTSMPSIRFGDSSQSQSMCMTKASSRAASDDGAPSPHHSEVSQEANKLSLRRMRKCFVSIARNDPNPRTLTYLIVFMQMEFVDSLTLREAIDQGIESDRHIWRISRQILSGIAYFTSLNVIHRDLKPSNIFLDVQGEVRIGDFGLAVNQNGGEVEGSCGPIPISTELTSGVGTALYIAPETIEARHIQAKHLEKIDIYSFGIVLFEMFHRMNTVHERIQIIKELRSTEIKFPSNWEDEPDGVKTRIIKWCLNHTAELRPSPTELLKSNLFPPQPEDENIEEITRLISRPDHAMFRPYLGSLFDQPLPDRIRRDFTYDFHTADASQKVLDNPFRTLICDHLTEKFCMRGAVNVESPVLVPYTDIDNPSLVKLLDSEGTVVTLHFDATIPFARTVARDESLIRLKRYSLSPMYRQNPAGGQPITIPVASYDIVSPTRTLAAESEILQLTDDVLRSLPLGGSFEHVLSHNKLWDAIFLDIPAHQRAPLQKMIGNYNATNSPSWSELSTELADNSGISKATLDAIKKSFDIRGNIELKPTSLVLPPPSYNNFNVREAIDDLEIVIKFAKLLGMQGAVIIWPMLLPQHRENSNGVFFNTCDTRKGKVLAAGGRFDGLVQKLVAPGLGQSQLRSHLVSVSMHVSRLSLAVARQAQMSNATSWMPRRCDVYVMSFAPGLLKDRLEVTRELWACGISADLMYDGETQWSSPEAILQSCRREGIIYAIIVKSPNPYKEQVVKVKSLSQKTEHEVSLRELSTWLEDALQEHARSESGNGFLKAIHENHGRINQKTRWNASPNPPIEAPSPGREYFLILPTDASRKTKHKSRQAVYERAFEAISDKIKSLPDVPTFVLDLEDPPFSKLFQDLSWMESEEVYRKHIVDLVPTSRKTYLWEIRHSILNHCLKSDSTKSLWIFSLRTNQCQLLIIP
ncbi:hypothetical protein PSTT_09072 [Puccinia striiformis]|uniref:non-specific serine/threonine protein kinase n=1 Tax=Puccinia striiformis TaxID=27350 RepID=A0A2S4V9L0_9BASI|nr:hypothetical protein PSTT_09072 [Puccinia striiformis]